jgi:hypothetical protein
LRELPLCFIQHPLPLTPIRQPSVLAGIILGDSGSFSRVRFPRIAAHHFHIAGTDGDLPVGKGHREAVPFMVDLAPQDLTILEDQHSAPCCRHALRAPLAVTPIAQG